MKKVKRKDCKSISDALAFIEKLAKRKPKVTGYLANTHNKDYTDVQWLVTWTEPERDKSEPEEKEGSSTEEDV